MQGWQATPGQTLLVPSGSKHHLHFVIFGPAVLADYGPIPQIAMVNVTTMRDDISHDPACIVEPGEHPFIKQRSYIAYRYLRIDALPHVEKMIGSNLWTPHDPCADDLLHRIVAGVCQSKLASREYKRVFECP